MQSHRGFTLVEVLIVLCFITVSLVIVLPGQHSAFSSLKEKRVMKTFADDIHFVQQLSVNRGEVHTLYINATDNSYQAYKDWGSPMIVTGSFPPDWEITFLSLKQHVLFYNNGTFSNPGTMLIETKNNEYRILFPFGRNGVVIDRQ
ncbi:competence protein ComGD [Salimicrobium halophilum]|uniref:Competence protein ComGD n=2 Tax=Salimicrobium halophilum TaxID=86666 RepID=A0A1G8PTS0_9BACI|nr:competence protein ComGD [Salimicrobium halophilum]